MKTSLVTVQHKTVVDAEGRYVEISDNFCELVGYTREELIGRQYKEFTAPETIDIPTIFDMFVREGYSQGLWVLLHRQGTPILVRYESWLRADRLIESKMEVLDGVLGIAPVIS